MAGEACVSEIQKDMDISQTIASHHLRILYNAGLINARREKNRIFYSLDSWSINQNCKGLELMVRKAFESDYPAVIHSHCIYTPVIRITRKTVSLLKQGNM